MKKNLKNLGLGMLSLLAIAFTSCNNDDDDGGTPAQKNILQTIQAEAQFSTLAKALRVTGLESILTGATKYTLFAPTNAAFQYCFITEHHPMIHHLYCLLQSFPPAKQKHTF